MREFLFSERMRLWLAGLAILLVAIAAGFAWHWSPERQVRLHQESLFHTLEEKRWERFGAFIADDYGDPWGQDRAVLLANVKEAFADYFACVVEPRDTVVVLGSDGSGEVSTRIALRGNGGPRAQFLMREAEELTQPFTFRWRKQSAWPWDWVLTRVEQPELASPVP